MTKGIDTKTKKEKHKPSIHRQISASSGSATTGLPKALPFIEAGAAGSLFTVVCFFDGVHEIATLSIFWLLFFCGKREVTT